MPEIGQSGSEGGVALTPPSLPLLGRAGSWFQYALIVASGLPMNRWARGADLRNRSCAPSYGFGKYRLIARAL